jgi:hypothetical protein
LFFYGCEAWSLTLREEHRLREYKNRPKSNEKTEAWETLHNEEFYDLYSSPNIIQVVKSRGMRCVGHVAHIRDKRGAYRVMVGRPEERGTTWKT